MEKRYPTPQEFKEITEAVHQSEQEKFKEAFLKDLAAYLSPDEIELESVVINNDYDQVPNPSGWAENVLNGERVLTVKIIDRKQQKEYQKKVQNMWNYRG